MSDGQHIGHGRETGFEAGEVGSSQLGRLATPSHISKASASIVYAHSRLSCVLRLALCIVPSMTTRSHDRLPSYLAYFS